MSEEKKQEEKIQVTKGFTVGVDAEGKIHVDPFGIANDLELLGLMNFVDIKREELLEYIAGTPSVKSLAIAQATGKGVATLLSTIAGQNAPQEAEVKVES